MDNTGHLHVNWGGATNFSVDGNGNIQATNLDVNVRDQDPENTGNLKISWDSGTPFRVNGRGQITNMAPA